METEIKEEGGSTCQPAEGAVTKRRVFLLFFAIDAIFIAAVGLYLVIHLHHKHVDRPIPSVPVPKYIAHAGGGIGKMAYTNSRDAFDANYRRGHRFFEFDLNWTSDGQLVLIHDWQGNFRDLFPTSKIALPPSLDEFLRLKMRNNLTPISFAGLADWLRTHPGARIVTDVKEDNLRALGKIAAEYPDLVDRIIPQIYAFEEYEPVWDMGYGNIILTLYLKNYADEPVLNFARSHRLFGVTMWIERAMGALPRELKKLNIPVFAHTVNWPEEQKKLESNGVSGFYTDFLGGKE
ncbi:MAG: glycerophosphodiester phosphodiesterase family protein [Thermoguttaceae bacterium]|jgi:glycerophosphoryl diester phosphodiesterase